MSKKHKKVSPSGTSKKKLFPAGGTRLSPSGVGKVPVAMRVPSQPDRTICMMEVDPKLIRLRREREERRKKYQQEYELLRKQFFDDLRMAQSLGGGTGLGQAFGGGIMRNIGPMNELSVYPWNVTSKFAPVPKRRKRKSK